MASQHWWVTGQRVEPGVWPCPSCGCPTQRTLTGTPLDGMTAHFAYCHPGQTPPARPAVHP